MLSQWKSDFIKNAAVVFKRNKDKTEKLLATNLLKKNISLLIICTVLIRCSDF